MKTSKCYDVNFSKTRTFIWNVTDLDNIEIVKVHVSQLTVTDHNQYIKGNLLFQSNYEVSQHHVHEWKIMIQVQLPYEYIMSASRESSAISIATL